MCSSKDRRADVVCTKCKLAYYCSKDCQNRDWDGNGTTRQGWHSLICPLIKGKKYDKLSGHIADTIVHALKEAAELIMDQIKVLLREFRTTHPTEDPVLFTEFEYNTEEILNATSLVISMKTWIESLLIKETQRVLKTRGMALVSDEAEKFLSGAFVNQRLSMRITNEAGTNIPTLAKSSSFYSAWHDKENLACVTRAYVVKGDGVFINRSILAVKDLVGVKSPVPPQPAPTAAKPPPTAATPSVPSSANLKVGLLISPTGVVTQTPPLDEDKKGSFAHYMGMEEVTGVEIGGIVGQDLVAFYDANWEIKKLPLNRTASYLGHSIKDNLHGDVLLIDEHRDLKIGDLEEAIKKLSASRKATREAAKARGVPMP
jgi:hypothetical protein